MYGYMALETYYNKQKATDSISFIDCSRSLLFFDRWKLTKISDPKIALMSDLPQVFTNRAVWFLSPTIVDNRFVNRFVNDSRENEPRQIYCRFSQTVRFVKTCGKFDIRAIFGSEFFVSFQRSTCSITSFIR